MSEHDQAVLHAIFNPSMPLQDILQLQSSECDSFIARGQRAHAAVRQELKFSRAEVEATRRSRQLQIDAVRACDQNKKPEEALALLDEAVKIPQQHTEALVAARNNRAQVRRLLKDNDGALDDLNYVLNATTNGTVACQAFTQRALLLRFMGEDAKAMHDFQAAAKLGCPMAKKMLSETNTYAAMCNKMLMKMFVNLRSGKPEDADFTKESFE